LALSMAIGVVAGLGAVVFYVVSYAVAHFALGGAGGYVPAPQPAGEPHLAWLPVVAAEFRPWVILAIAAGGGRAGR
jgi:hypothetical protein